MRLSIIAAVATNGIIGRDNGLPWHLPDDLKWFKKLTTGHTIIMGRRTFESIGRALPNRRTIVLTGNPDSVSGVETAVDLAAALALAAQDDEVFVVGGAAVYRAALSRAERLYLTRVHADVPGDVQFPELNDSSWRVVSEELHPADERHQFPFTFAVLDRVVSSN